MTFQSAPPAKGGIAAPLGAMLLYPSAVSSPAVNAVLPWSAKQSLIGNLAADSTLSGGKVTLPAGYWYFVDASAQAISSTFDSNDQLQYQWHNESAYIGTRGRVAFNGTSSFALLSSYDERALALVYAASALTLSLRVLVNSGVTGANSTAEAQYTYAGMGRAVVFQLQGAAP